MIRSTAVSCETTDARLIKPFLQCSFPHSCHFLLCEGLILERKREKRMDLRESTPNGVGLDASPEQDDARASGRKPPSSTAFRDRFLFASPGGAGARWSPYSFGASLPDGQEREPRKWVQSARDRFIPCRAPLDCSLSNFLLEAPSDELDADSTPTQQDYMNTLRESMMLSNGDTKILPLRSPRPGRGTPNTPGSVQFAAQGLIGAPLVLSPAVAGGGSPKRRKATRFIPKSPDKILDAPDLVDDYYLNLLDWSRSNILAVQLALDYDLSTRTALCW